MNIALKRLRHDADEVFALHNNLFLRRRLHLVRISQARGSVERIIRVTGGSTQTKVQ
jgi:hypothetical protein